MIIAVLDAARRTSYPSNMHIYFSGIGGAGIGPLAQIAAQAGHDVSGSDKQDSSYIQYLRTHGIPDIHIGQDTATIAHVHEQKPIDWFVYSSAVVFERADAPELQFCHTQGITTSKRDVLLNQLLQDSGQKMIAIAGTHGKTTTTALVTWLCLQIGEPISYLLPAKTNFAELGSYNPKATYFVYEADEFDRNFLAYEPAVSLITGVSWDHHEIFPTREDYQSAFREFIEQSAYTCIWEEDADYLELAANSSTLRLSSSEARIQQINLKGAYNRLDAWLAIQAVHRLTGAPIDSLLAHASAFPGLSRRMERLAPNLYSDYAHTPEKIRGAMSVASEMAAETGQKLIVVYEPLTNRRQHYMLDSYGDCFAGADKLYWIPSYLAREDASQRIIPPSELIAHLPDPSFAVAAERDAKLQSQIQAHLAAGDMVVCMAGGGGDSLDDWLRATFTH